MRRNEYIRNADITDWNVGRNLGFISEKRKFDRLKYGLFIIIVLSSVWFVFGLPPTKATVEKFLKENCCCPSCIETHHDDEYFCAAYLRRHTTSLCGQIFWVPEFTFLFIFTPFHYFNYVDPTTFDCHVYVFVVTRDEGILVYNPVNGKYVGRFDDLLQNMKNNMHSQNLSAYLYAHYVRLHRVSHSVR